MKGAEDKEEIGGIWELPHGADERRPHSLARKHRDKHRTRRLAARQQIERCRRVVAVFKENKAAQVVRGVSSSEEARSAYVNVDRLGRIAERAHSPLGIYGFLCSNRI